MARILAVRLQPSAADEMEIEVIEAATDESLTGNAPNLSGELPAKVIAPAASTAAKLPPFKVQPELVAMPARIPGVDAAPGADEARYASRNWRAEAWDRERERSMRSDRGPGIVPRRRLGA